MTEAMETVDCLIEESDGGKKNYFIEGIWMQGNIKNRNGRLYPTSILENEVNRYVTESINAGRALGELGHPDGPNINMPLVSHKITEMRRVGDNFVGRAKILDTPNGRIVKEFMDNNIVFGVSSRGMGTLKENSQGIPEVQADFRLATAGDIVQDPSAPDAFVKGIMEGVEWEYDDDDKCYRRQIVAEIKESYTKKSKMLAEHDKLRLFARFLRPKS